MILELHRQGLSVSAIAQRLGLDRKTVRKYVARGLEPPAYGPRPPRPGLLAPFESYLRDRVAAYPELTGARLWREIKELGYTGGYTAVKEFLRDVRPAAPAGFEQRFETPPGRQAQVDFAQFKVVFGDEPDAIRIVRLFALVLGHSRFLWARFVAHHRRQRRRSVCAAAPVRRPARGPADPLALPHGGLRRPGRGPGRGPLRSHADGGDRRGARGPRRLQPSPARARPPLRLPAARLPALPGEDEGESGAALPLRPPGLLPGALVPAPRGPERPAARLARPGCQFPPPCDHRADRRRSVRRGASVLAALADDPLPGGAAPRAARVARGPDRRRRQLLQRAGQHQETRARGPQPGRRDPDLRGWPAHRDPSRARGAAPHQHRRRPPPHDTGDGRRRHEPLPVRRTGDVVARRPLAFYEAVGRRLAGGARP